tara:strand:- start:274 stop:441 length:168 start_codon:yes stop_codon:yes gene_type:complete
MAQLTKKEMLSGLKHYDNTEVTYKIIEDTKNYMSVEIKFPSGEKSLLEWGEEDAT